MKSPLFLAVLLVSAAPPASAATHTWDGGGTNANWSNAVNWQADTAPVPGDALVFPTGALQLISVNDFPAGTAFAGITVSAAYQLSGNGITLNGGFTASALGSPVLAQMPLKLAGAQTFSHNGTGLVTLGDVDTNGNALTLSITSTGAAAPGSISGAGSVTKSGTGPLTLAAVNTYNGVTMINAGVVSVSETSPLGTSGAGAGNTVIAAGAELKLVTAGDYSLEEEFSLAGTIRQITAATGTHTLTGNIALTGGTAVQNAASLGTIHASSPGPGPSGFTASPP